MLLMPSSQKMVMVQGKCLSYDGMYLLHAFAAEMYHHYHYTLFLPRGKVRLQGKLQ